MAKEDPVSAGTELEASCPFHLLSPSSPSLPMAQPLSASLPPPWFPNIQSWPLQPTLRILLKHKPAPPLLLTFPGSQCHWDKIQAPPLPAVASPVLSYLLLLAPNSSGFQHSLVFLHGSLFSTLYSYFRTQPQLSLLQESLPMPRLGHVSPSAQPSGPALSGDGPVSPMDCEPHEGRGRALSVTTVSPAPRTGIWGMNG